MKEIRDGVMQFRKEVFPAHRVLFDRLAHGQSPTVMFIACSDSRVDPSLLTQSPPGSLFVLRNAGNLVPQYQAGAEAATIEYAVDKLEVHHIVVCGHSDCGAMTALMSGVDDFEHPAIADWLSHASDVGAAVMDRYGAEPLSRRVEAAVAINVAHQLRNLASHPSVARALGEGRLVLHGWVYDIGSGSVSVTRPGASELVPLDAVPAEAEMLEEVAHVEPAADAEEWLDHGAHRALLTRVDPYREGDTVEALVGLLGCSMVVARTLLGDLPVELMHGITSQEGAIIAEWMRSVGAEVSVVDTPAVQKRPPITNPFGVGSA